MCREFEISFHDLDGLIIGDVDIFPREEDETLLPSCTCVMSYPDDEEGLFIWNTLCERLKPILTGGKIGELRIRFI